MQIDKPNNILVKINSIQENIKLENKTKSSAFIPMAPQISKSAFNQNNNYFISYLNNNFSKKETNSQLQINDLKTKETMLTNPSIQNTKFKSNNSINGTTNSLDDPSTENPNTKKDDLRINQTKPKNKEISKFKKKKIFKKFKICHIEYPKITRYDENGRSLNKLKHKRKYKPDDIRKKIKARFHKSIKNIINDNLRKAGSKKLFTFLPQVFISSISREKNKPVLNISFRELLQKNFVNDSNEKKYKNRNVDLAKYKRNLGVLEYLDKNPEICKRSGFDLISKMKYCDLLNEYFQSDEFERAIFKLREENEDEEYIKEYINKSKNYVNFFMDIPCKIKTEIFKTTSQYVKKPEEK